LRGNATDVTPSLAKRALKRRTDAPRRFAYFLLRNPNCFWRERKTIESLGTGKKGSVAE
jgi:hypothetical protein